MKIIRHVHHLTGWRQLGAAFLAGSLSVLALAPFNLWPMLFVTFPVLVWLIDGVRERHAHDHPAIVQNSRTDRLGPLVLAIFCSVSTGSAKPFW